MNIPDEAARRYPEDYKTIGGNAGSRRDFTAGAEWARKEARAQLLTELRWLAAARAEYCHLNHHDVGAYHRASDMEKHLHQEHVTAEGVADILDGTNDGMGWLPSWRWDDWTELHALAEGPADASQG